MEIDCGLTMLLIGAILGAMALSYLAGHREGEREKPDDSKGGCGWPE